jgi:hypothetical protein
VGDLVSVLLRRRFVARYQAELGDGR